MPVCLSVCAAPRIRHQRAQSARRSASAFVRDALVAADAGTGIPAPGLPHRPARTALVVLAVLVLASTTNPDQMWSSDDSADFYGVISTCRHGDDVWSGVALRRDGDGNLGTAILASLGHDIDRIPSRSARRGPRRNHAPSPSRQWARLRVESGGPPSVATMVPPLHLLWVCALPGINDRRGDLPQRVWMGGAVPVLEPSGPARHCWRIWSAGRASGTGGAQANAGSRSRSRREPRSRRACSSHSFFSRA